MSNNLNTAQFAYYQQNVLLCIFCLFQSFLRAPSPNLLTLHLGTTIFEILNDFFLSLSSFHCAYLIAACKMQTIAISFPFVLPFTSCAILIFFFPLILRDKISRLTPQWEEKKMKKAIYNKKRFLVF